MKTFALLLVMAAVGVAEDSLPGAKAYFYNATSDVEIKDGGPAVGTKPKTPGHQGPGGGSGGSNTGAVGVQYSIELQTPDGKMSTVPSTYTFHTGDRIRLHIKTNVDGRLVVMQSQDQGPYRLLFPPSPSADNRVKKFGDNVFPPKFFRFDQNPGDVKLMLMVTADGAKPNMVAVTVPLREAPGPQTQVAPPPPSQAPPVVPVDSTPPPPGGTQDLRADYDAKMRAEYEKLKGSKALIMEDDTTGPDPSTTVVAVPWRDGNITPGVVVVEVRLKHRP
jgi:hypothetical protein